MLNLRRLASQAARQELCQFGRPRHPAQFGTRQHHLPSIHSREPQCRVRRHFLAKSQQSPAIKASGQSLESCVLGGPSDQGTDRRHDAGYTRVSRFAELHADAAPFRELVPVQDAEPTPEHGPGRRHGGAGVSCQQHRVPVTVFEDSILCCPKEAGQWIAKDDGGGKVKELGDMHGGGSASGSGKVEAYRTSQRPGMLRIKGVLKEADGWRVVGLHYATVHFVRAMVMSNQIESAVNEAQGRLERLQGFLQHDPDNMNLLADVVDVGLSSGNLAAARSALEHALALDVGNPHFLLRRSSLAIAEGDYGGACAITAALLEQGFRDRAIRYNHAYAQFAAGNLAAAREELLSLNDEDKADGAVARLLIRADHYLGDLDAAIAVGLSYLELCPADTMVAGMLALIYFDAEDLVSAAEWAERSLSSGGNNLDGLLAAGSIALARENGDEAKAFLARALDVQPGNGRAWLNLAVADMLVLDLPAARAKLEEAVKLMPRHLGSWNVLGWVLLMQGDVQAAEASFTEALSIDDNFGESHGGLAAVAAARGQWDLADQHSKVARRLDPGGMASNYAQLVRFQKEGRGDLAQKLVESALRKGKAPAGGNLLDMLGRVTRRNRQ